MIKAPIVRFLRAYNACRVWRVHILGFGALGWFRLQAPTGRATTSTHTRWDWRKFGASKSQPYDLQLQILGFRVPLSPKPCNADSSWPGGRQKQPWTLNLKTSELRHHSPAYFQTTSRDPAVPFKPQPVHAQHQTKLPWIQYRGLNNYLYYFLGIPDYISIYIYII